MERTYSEGVNTELLREQFPEIVIGDSVSYSAKCSSENEFNQLTNAVLKQVHCLDSYKMELPKNWFGIINEIKNGQNDYISKKQYREICEENNVISPDIRKWLLSWFHDLGYCFCNHTDPDTGCELEDYQVIHPNWITTAMYRINHAHDALNGDGYYVNEINFENGTISPSTLYFLINDDALGGQTKQPYGRNEVDYILSVMRKFKLSYRISPALEFIPILCNYEKPDDRNEIDSVEALVYYIKYAYLPDSIIHRLMISLYQNDHVLSAVWRYGFCLNIRDYFNPEGILSIAIEMDRKKNMLKLKISGKAAKERWECLEYILKFITRINLETNCQTVAEYVEKRKGDQTAHLPLSSILKARELGHSEIWSTDGGEYESYPLTELMGAALAEESAKDSDDFHGKTQIHRYIPVNGHHDGIIPSAYCGIEGDVYIVSGDNASVNNNLDAGQILALMERVLANPLLTESTVDELQEALCEEDSSLKEELQSAKENNESRKNIFLRGVERTKKAINTANDVHDTVESGIDTFTKVKESGGKVIHVAKPVIEALIRHAASSCRM